MSNKEYGCVLVLAAQQCCYRAEISAREPYRPANLSGPVLFCIDTSDSESRRIFQHFSRSTRLPHLCTAPVLIFALFCKFSLNFPDFCKILRICQQIEHFSPQISRNFAGIAGNDGELLEVCEFCRKMQKFSRGIWEFECMGKKEFEIKFREKGKGIYSRLN